MSEHIQDVPFDISTLKLDDIIIVQAGIDNPKSLSALSSDKFMDVGFQIEAGFNKKESKIRMIMKCDITAPDHTELKGSFEIAFYFSLTDFDLLVKINEEDNKADVEENLLTTLSDITYSTSRGIIYSRCLGTPFAKVLLPVISNSNLMNTLLGKNKTL